VQDGTVTSHGNVEVAVGKIIELAVPFDSLRASPEQPISFFVELFSGSTSLDRIPREGTIDLAVPPPEFERIMWQV
jgi:hypothetical protein